ncbi:hypothetical protein RAL98_03300 [Staphylococcus sp. HKU1]|uniref:hypothetical protein n=1 Tax=Staphylococcus sp. HKU1 TaxID=3068989 RepID=UPI003AAEE39B
MRKIYLVGLVIILTLVLSACSDAQDKAQGKWETKTAQGKMTMVIKKDKMKVDASGVTLLEGKIIDKNKDSFIVKLKDYKTKHKFTFKGDDKLKAKEGNTWKKVKDKK